VIDTFQIDYNLFDPANYSPMADYRMQDLLAGH